MKDREFYKVCADYCATLSYTPLYYPRADPTERVNRVVKTMIAQPLKEDHRRWADKLSAIGCAICTSRHEFTGFTSFFANFGREHKLRGDEHNDAMAGDELRNVEVVSEKRVTDFKEMFLKIAYKIRNAHERNKKV